MSNPRDNQSHNQPKNQPTVLPTKPATPPVIEAAKSTPATPPVIEAATPVTTPKQAMPESDAAKAAAAPIVAKPAVELGEKAKPAISEPAKH